MARKVREKSESKSRLVSASFPASFKNVQAIDIRAARRAKRAPYVLQMHLINRETNASPKQTPRVIVN